MKRMTWTLAALLITGCNNVSTTEKQSIPNGNALSSSKTETQNSNKTDSRTITKKQLDARITALRYFLQMQSGLEPIADAQSLSKLEAEYQSSMQKAIDSVSVALSAIGNAKQSHSNEVLLGNCERYYGLTRDSLTDVRDTEVALKDQPAGTETSILARIRLSVVRSFLDQLEHGIKNQMDGSYITAGLGVKCPIQERAQVQQSLNTFLDTFSKYWTARFGLDPILSDKNLLQVKEVTQKHESRQVVIKTAYFVGMTVLTVAFWELAVVRGAAMVGQVAALGSASIAVARGIMIVGASAGMARMDRAMFPEDYSIPRAQTVSEWNELMSQLEDFLDLSLKSATSYAPYVYEADRTRLMYLIEFLERRGKDLESAEEKYGSLESALAYHENLKTEYLRTESLKVGLK